LNAFIESDRFTPDLPSTTFRIEGKLISVTERTITVNIGFKFENGKGGHNL